MEPAIRTEQGLGPGFLADQGGFRQQGHRLGQQVVKTVQGDLLGVGIGLNRHRDDGVSVRSGAAQGREEGADTPFGRELAFLKAEALGVVGVARVAQVP